MLRNRIIQICALALFLFTGFQALALFNGSGKNPDLDESLGKPRPALAESLELSVSARYLSLPVNSQQEFWLRTSQAGVPLAGLQAQLTLILPEHNVALYLFPLTADDGTAFLQIDPIVIEPGSVVRYEVCVFLQEENQCSWSEFVIADSNN